MMHPKVSRSHNTILSVFLVLLTLLYVSGSVSVSSEARVGVKVGDWIKLNYTFVSTSNATAPPSNESSPTWMKVEILGVNTTQASVDVRMTMHMSDETEINQTGTLNLTAGADNGPALSGLVIPANLGVGDSAYTTSYGNVIIAGETTGTYIGASRSIVNANFSQQGNQMTLYWDKQTGALIEVHVTSGSTNATARAVETNMWQPQLLAIPIDQAVLYALTAAIAILIVVVFALRHRKKTPKEMSSEKVASSA